jgi:hypothetical protein
MKRVVVATLLAIFAAPAFAQIADPGIEALMKRYADRFNKGDVATLANEIYAKGDQAALTAKFEALRRQEFGKLDLYGFKACPVAGGKTRVEMRYGLLYTYGGLMNGDQAKVFDLVKTPSGWRIASETDTPFDQQLICG